MPVMDDRDKYLYHYTNPRGSNGILNDRLIRVTEAESRFAWYGRGVYMTALSPTVGRHKLLYNNHRKRDTRDSNLWAKTSIYFKIHMKFLPGAEQQYTKDGRNVWVYRNHIYLYNVRYETGYSDDYKEPQAEYSVPRRALLPASNAGDNNHDLYRGRSQMNAKRLYKRDVVPTYQSISNNHPTCERQELLTDSIDSSIPVMDSNDSSRSIIVPIDSPIHVIAPIDSSSSVIVPIDSTIPVIEPTVRRAKKKQNCCTIF
ncbi:hypothetical protein CHUAL_002238 [Chamberlinius hualienensis]